MGAREAVEPDQCNAPDGEDAVGNGNASGEGPMLSRGRVPDEGEGNNKHNDSQRQNILED